MPSSLKMIKVRQLALAKSVQGFNFEQSRYDKRKSFKDALDLFFTDFAADLHDLSEAYNFDVPQIPPTLSIDPEGCDDFYRQSLCMLTQALEEFAAIAKTNDIAKSEEEIATLEQRKQLFKDGLRSKLQDLRSHSKLFLAAYYAHDIKMSRETFKALNIWEYLTFFKFLRMLKAGTIDWITGRKTRKI
ncbi:MAG: hypothetical protein HQK54_02095 [Oligoflexales bacterium]|nr:hypothetical protein [Oligoflexales bacterium]